jgi:two-component system response regulator HydG
LHERREDIPILADYFIKNMNQKTGKQITGLSTAAMRIFMDHPWPGNVRELENAIEHAFVLCNRKEIDSLDLPVEIRQPAPAGVCIEASFGKPRPRRKTTKAELLNLLDECDWNKAGVGRRVGLSRTAIWNYMKKYDIPLQQKE